MCLWLFLSCGRLTSDDYVVLSYCEEVTSCMGCPHFRVELRKGGHVNLFGLSGCAIPGEHHFRIPESAFSTLIREFHSVRFFSIPRLDPRYMPEDALMNLLPGICSRVAAVSKIIHFAPRLFF